MLKALTSDPQTMLPHVSRRQLISGAAWAAALAAIPRPGQADDYPSRPIRLVIPYSAGGSGDQIGRPWADRMTSLLGPIFVENIGGAGGAIGATAVAREPADGYSILLGNGSTQVIIPRTSANRLYSKDDFRPIYRFVNSALVFAVHPSIAVSNLRELISYAKANPGGLSYGTPGVGTGNHLVGELFKQQSSIKDMVHVPYRGAALATNDLMRGQIPLVIAVMTTQLQQLARTGHIRLLAVTTERRLGGAPEIPTAVESGMPDLRYEGWFGLFVLQSTSEVIIDRIVAATRTAMAEPALQIAYRTQGLEPDSDSNPDKFRKVVDATTASLAPVIDALGFKSL